MELLIAVSLAVMIGCGYVWYAKSLGSTKSKYFKLYVVLVNPGKARDFSITDEDGSFVELATIGLLTYIKPRKISGRGLEPHQIVGTLNDWQGGIVPKNFNRNKAFKDKLHAIAATEVPSFVRERAKILEVGQIKLIDDRNTSLLVGADDEDCIGVYTVENGIVVSYEPNPLFCFLSEKGPLELVESIRAILYSETKMFI